MFLVFVDLWSQAGFNYSHLLLVIDSLSWNFRSQTIILIQIKIYPEVMMKKVFHNVKLYLYLISFFLMEGGKTTHFSKVSTVEVVTFIYHF